MAITIDGTNITYPDGSTQNERRPKLLGYTGNAGGTTIQTFSGIPANAMQVTITLWDVAASASDLLRLKLDGSNGTLGLGNGATMEAAASSYGCTDFGSSSTTSYIPLTRTGSTSYAWSGRVTIYRPIASFDNAAGYRYHIDWVLGSTSTTFRQVWGSGQLYSGNVAGHVLQSVSLYFSGTNTFKASSGMSVEYY